VMMGHDAQCASWIRKYREPLPESADGGEARGRHGGREGRRRQV
jgi:5-methyltetrahydrofolate--homocysteine methyltransferase